MAGYFCQLVEGAVEPGHRDAPLHDLLRRGLDHLDAEEPSMRALLHFEKQLAEILGSDAWPDVHMTPEEALRAHIGRLPDARKEIVERLGGG